MDNKDHLGEKLRLKELADEDRYFGERDREILVSLKARQAAEQEGARCEQSRGRCPQCGNPLSVQSVYDKTTLECLLCQGVWLHADKRPTVVNSSTWFVTFLQGLGWWRTFNRHGD